MADLAHDFVSLRRGGSWLWVDRGLVGDPVVDLLWYPDRLLDRRECVSVKDQKKIKVGRLPLPIAGQARTVYIKRYNAYSVRTRVGSLFLGSRAVRSLRGAAILKIAGVATARSVAAVELRSWGTIAASFYLSEEIVGGKTADAYWRDDLAWLAGMEGRRRRRRFIERLALLFQGLHWRGVYHNDLKDANIIVVPEADTESIYLVDLEGVRRFRQVSLRRRVKNLAQLDRSLGGLLARAEKLYFLKIYLGSGPEAGRLRRAWVTRVLKASRRPDPNRAGRSPVP